MSPQRTPKDLYNDAISQYEQVSSGLETDDATREEANKQIKVLRTKLQDAAFDNIVARTGNFQELVLSLQAVAKKAQHGGVNIAGITALITEAQGIMDTIKSLRGAL